MLMKEVRDWLKDYKRLSPSEVHTFAYNLNSNEELIQGLHKLFDTVPCKAQDLDPVCHQLYEFYRSDQSQLQIFALEFVPKLIWLYLKCLSVNEKALCGGVETVLLGIYNLEIMSPDGSPLVESFRIPSISKASIYHECRSQGMSEQLRQLSQGHFVWRSGPFPQYETFHAQNRSSIMSLVMQRYNKDIDKFQDHSLQSVCQVSHRLCHTGFVGVSDSKPRIPVYPALLVELLMAVYFAMFNGYRTDAMRAVESVHVRASYELYSDVLLVTNALKNSHQRGNFRFHQEEEVQAKNSRIVNPSSKRSIITNASFKARKLPDDIDFVEQDENQRLSTVEENEAEHSLAKGLKAKLMTIGGKLGGDKNRNREGSRRDSDTPSLKTTQVFDVTDSIDAVVPRGIGGGRAGNKVVVDVLEMQPIQEKFPINNDGGPSVDGDKGDDYSDDVNTDVEKHGEPDSLNQDTFTSCSEKVASNSFTFSKKHGLIKVPASSGNNNQSSSKPPPNSHMADTTAHNGKNIITSISKPASSGHSQSRAHSEGPVSKDLPSKVSSMSSVSSATISAVSDSNTSEPNHSESSLSNPTSPPSLISDSHSTHSMPAGLVSSSKRPERSSSSKSHVNRNSYSTDL